MDPPPNYAIDGTGDPNTRLDIVDFSTNPDHKIQWGLFIQAVAKLQLALPPDPLGYYRIAGIHGSPRVTWPELEVQPGQTMYCSHEITRFLTWHRAYLLLFEQRLVAMAISLAPKEYMDQALRIRIPYWDWAVTPSMPQAAITEEITIWTSDTTQITIKNPLYSYTYTGPPGAGDSPVTVRDPLETVNLALAGAGLREDVYHSLVKKQDYAPFSNLGFPGGLNSVEKPHNSVHRAIGGGMADPLVTAFDPIFWFFHTLIDRYYALWQTINPDIFYSENHVGANTIDYWLSPFKRSEPAGAWTSRMVQRSETHIPNTWVFGVQYPETLVKWTDEERESAVWATIRKYGPPASEKLYPPGAVPKNGQYALPNYPTDLPEEACIRREWRVTIKAKNDLVVENFTIFVFLGTPGEDPEKWGIDANTVGSLSTFKAPLESCRNCREVKGELIHGSVYLTDKLHKLLPPTSRLENQASLTPWLVTNLDWRIRKANGTEVLVTPDIVAGLSVGVESFMEAYAPVDENNNPIDCDLGKILGRTFDHVRHPDVTRGKSNKGGEIIIH